MPNLLGSLTLRSRLIALGAVALSALAVLGVATLVLMSEVSTRVGTSAGAQAQDTLLARAYESWILNDDQNNMYAAVVALRDPSDAALANTTWEQAAAAYRSAVGDLARLRGAFAAEPADLARLRRIHRALVQYDGFSLELRRAGIAGQVTRAIWVQTVGNLAPSNALPVEFQELGDALQAAELHSSGAVRSKASSAIVITLVVLGIAAPLLLLVVITTIRSITSGVARIKRRVGELREDLSARLSPAVRALAAGDLTVHVSSESTAEGVDRADELGAIMRLLEDMRESVRDCCTSYNSSTGHLRELIGRVTSTAGLVNDSSRQVALSSEETGAATVTIADTMATMAAGATRQVEMIEAAHRAAERVAAGVARSAAHAGETADVAARARQSAQDGMRAAEQADSAIRAAHTTSRSVSDAINELAEKSEQIGTIVAAITSIAEQTDLLALNAAIEAARAGEHGRGFAVVADEVRQLAEESKRAGDQITQLVGTIQAQTASVVHVVADGAARTAEGAGVMHDAREAFLTINAAIDDISARVHEIAAISQEMNASAQDMQRSVSEAVTVAELSVASTGEVSSNTQQASAATEEIAATAHELEQNAGALDQLVATFTL